MQTSPRTFPILTALAAAFLAAPAAATTFMFDWHTGMPTSNLSINHSVGSVESFQVSFDDAAERLTWQASFLPMKGSLPDGGWLVLSNGPNPKGDVLEWAIYYIDGIHGTLTTYAYDGANSDKSWQHSAFLQSDPDAVSLAPGPGGSLRMSFQVDVSGINAAGLGPDWQGTRFANEVGIWFHPTQGTDTLYHRDGSLASWQTAGKGFFDGTGPLGTVPEPSTGALLALAAGLLAGCQRYRCA